jgi:hypothetical protein
VVKRDGTVETPAITIYVEPVADAPVIRRFTVDPPGQILLGECVSIQWKVAGDVDTVALTANDTVIWEPAPSSGSTQDCPVVAGTITYGIVAVGPGGTSNGSQTIRVVEPAEPATPVPTTPPEQPTATEEPPEIAPPVISAFAVTPAEIQAGESVGIRWAVSGGTSYSRILRNGVVIMDNAGLIGQAVDLLPEPGTYVYQLEAYNPIEESVRAEQTVTVTGAE